MTTNLFYEYVVLDKDSKGYFLSVKNIGIGRAYSIYYKDKKTAKKFFAAYGENAKKVTDKVN